MTPNLNIKQQKKISFEFDTFKKEGNWARQVPSTSFRTYAAKFIEVFILIRKNKFEKF